MIAENKEEFFEQLERELKKLGVEDTKELMTDFEEHFEEGERRGIPESETCRELGNIGEIARSCLDLKSTAINSMVARDVERKKVSLTKPGHSEPADPSLASNNSETENTADEDCVRSYTPEHNSEEIYPNAAQNTSTSGANPDSDSVKSEENSSSAENTSSENAENKTSTHNGGTFAKVGETVGKAVDEACDIAGKAVNKAWNKVENAFAKTGDAAANAFRPSDDYRKDISKDKKGGELPPQFNKVKTKGDGKFIDTTGMKPNVNAGRLVFEIILDIIMWIWLIPTVFALFIGFFAAALAMIGVGILCILGNNLSIEGFWGIIDFGCFKFISRLLFSLGFWNLSAAFVCLACKLIKPAVSLVQYVIKRHIKAVYDI